jgi:hypothetical protein
MHRGARCGGVSQVVTKSTRNWGAMVEKCQRKCQNKCQNSKVYSVEGSTSRSNFLVLSTPPRSNCQKLSKNGLKKISAKSRPFRHGSPIARGIPLVKRNGQKSLRIFEFLFLSFATDIPGCPPTRGTQECVKIGHAFTLAKALVIASHHTNKVDPYRRSPLYPCSLSPD